MSKRDFLNRVRMGRNLVAHHRPGDARTPVWFDPATVLGYRPDDFPELTDAERDGLTDAVRRFEQAVAVPVPTDDQRRDAAAALDAVVTALSRYYPRRDPAAAARAALARAGFPDWVANWDCELGTDPYGEPTVVVTVFVDEDRLPTDLRSRIVAPLMQRAREALEDAGIHWWPDILIRTVENYHAGVTLPYAPV